MKQRLKRHELFTPVFGIHASLGVEPHLSLWQQIVERLSDSFASVGELRFHQSLVTGKSKALFFGEAGADPLVLKIPLDSAAQEDEKKNWSFITFGKEFPFLMAPLPLHRGSINGLAYYVERRITGRPLFELIDAFGEHAGIDAVADYLEGVHAALELRSGRYDDSVLEEYVVNPAASLRSVVGHSDRLDSLREYLIANLKGLSLSMGFAHGDLSVSNVLFDKSGIAGVVDWADATRAGLPILDVIGHVESRIRRARGINISDSVSIILERDFDDQLDEFLNRLMRALRLTRDALDCHAYLYWLVHMGRRATEALNRKERRSHTQIQESFLRLSIPG